MNWQDSPLTLRTLVIDSATAACSAALFDGEACIAARHEVIGRGHAERLVPMIGELGPLHAIDRILVDVGPGSFTGVRIGVSVARALGFALDVPCHGYSAVPLVAAMALYRNPDLDAVAVVAIGGHGEYFTQEFGADLQALTPLQSIPFDDAVHAISRPCIAGDAAQEFIERRGNGTAIPLGPDAAYWPLIAHLPALPTAPLYVREPDAALPATRR